MFDDLVQLLVQLPGLVVQRSYVGVPSRMLDIMGDGGPSEGIEPVVLREGALSADRARHLVDQAVEGTPLPLTCLVPLKSCSITDGRTIRRRSYITGSTTSTIR